MSAEIRSRAASIEGSALGGFGVQPPTRAELRAQGKAHRSDLPLAAHAESGADRPDRDAVGVLRAQEDAREHGLIPLRYGRMAASPFAFLRGSAAVMARDLAASPSTGLTVQLCGDAHVANFGMYAAPDRSLVFDLNDFDETYPGPFEWDVKRLAASVVVAACAGGASDAARHAAAVTTVKSYRKTIAAMAAMSPLEAWYARVEVDELAARLRRTALGKGVRRAAKKSLRNTGDVAVGKLTEAAPDGRLRFRADQPLLVPVDDHLEPGIDARVAVLFDRYLSTLTPDRQVLLSRFGYRAVAHKVVGVGSVGTRALVLLFESGDGDALLLQVKQAGRSVLETISPPASTSPEHAGRRVVNGQRLLQAASDPFLGWTEGTRLPRREYFVRQLRDMKGGVDLTALDGEGLAMYGRVCGAVLARAHARAGSAAMIAGYLGGSSAFDEAVASFAVDYADVTERDHAALCAAIADGVVPATTV
ncbi:DUF2252 domain-containing protein [Microbacterium sp. CCNWLW134]|uniref:DUF2252 domain-containing protein n=1 Tax=Microbacterium sp. CCNWLW134 TaxID=3122064 RepID=UPI0030102ADB